MSTRCVHLPEFVTVKEAIALLGLSDRTIRRYVATLPPHAVATPKKGAVKYRLADLAELAGKEPAPMNATAPLPHAVAEDITAPTGADGVPMDATAGNGALIEQLQKENTRLWQALTEAQSNLRESHANERKALDELAATRQQNAVLIAATATGRIVPPGIADNAIIAPDAPDSGGTVPDGESVPSGTRDNENEPHAENMGMRDLTDAPSARRWWEFWKHG